METKYFKTQPSHKLSYNIIFKPNEKIVGKLVLLEDGDYYVELSYQKGYLAGYILRELADLVDMFNQPKMDDEKDSNEVDIFIES